MAENGGCPRFRPDAAAGEVSLPFSAVNDVDDARSDDGGKR
jgi:hypothetical protein